MNNKSKSPSPLVPPNQNKWCQPVAFSNVYSWLSFGLFGWLIGYIEVDKHGAISLSSLYSDIGQALHNPKDMKLLKVQCLGI